MYWREVIANRAKAKDMLDLVSDLFFGQPTYNQSGFSITDVNIATYWATEKGLLTVDECDFIREWYRPQADNGKPIEDPQ